MTSERKKECVDEHVILNIIVNVHLKQRMSYPCLNLTFRLQNADDLNNELSKLYFGHIKSFLKLLLIFTILLDKCTHSMKQNCNSCNGDVFEIPRRNSVVKKLSKFQL